MRRLLIGLGAVVAVLVPSSPAWAHNQLVEAAPAAGSTVTSTPRTVKLRFLERLRAGFTTIVVADAGRQRVPTGEPAVDGSTGVVTPAEPLPSGVYTVAYRIVSVDGHAVQGSYSFTVADPARPAVAPASVVPSTVALPESHHSSPAVAIAVGAAGVVVLVALGVGARRLRRGLRAAASEKGARPS